MLLALGDSVLWEGFSGLGVFDVAGGALWALGLRDLAVLGLKLFWGGWVGRYSFMCVGFSGGGGGLRWFDGPVGLWFETVLGWLGWWVFFYVRWFFWRGVV